MRIDSKQTEKLGTPPPRLHRVYLSPKARKTLADLENPGLNIPAAWGDGKVRVKFFREGSIFREPGTGWCQQRIRSEHGARSTVLVEPDNVVSGMVALTRRTK